MTTAVETSSVSQPNQIAPQKKPQDVPNSEKQDEEARLLRLWGPYQEPAYEISVPSVQDE